MEQLMYIKPAMLSAASRGHHFTVTNKGVTAQSSSPRVSSPPISNFHQYSPLQNKQIYTEPPGDIG